MLAWPSWTPCYDERMHSILSTLMICGRFFFSALVSVLPSGTWVASSTRGKAESIKTRCGFYKRRANAEFVASPRTVGCVSVRNLTHHIPNVYLLSHVWASVFNLHSITLSLSLFFSLWSSSFLLSNLPLPLSADVYLSASLYVNSSSPFSLFVSLSWCCFIFFSFHILCSPSLSLLSSFSSDLSPVSSSISLSFVISPLSPLSLAPS